MSFAEIRHIDGIIGAFWNWRKKIDISVDTAQIGTLPQQAIHSSMKVFVQQHQYLFNILWNKAIPAEDKIKEIKKGIIPEKIESIN